MRIERVTVRDPGVADLLAAHVALMDAGPEPVEATHRLEAADLDEPAITLLATFDGDDVVAIGALVAREGGWGEIKSMHVAADRRGYGLGRDMLSALESEARRQDLTVVRLETGTSMKAALRLYEDAGYTRRASFGDYPDHPASVFLDKTLND